MGKTKVLCRTSQESSFILWYLIPPLPVTHIAVHGDVAKSNGDPFYLYLHISSLALSCPSLCWTWHAGYLGCPLAEVYALVPLPIPGRAAWFTGLRETCQTRLKWFFVLLPVDSIGRWLAKAMSTNLIQSLPQTKHLEGSQPYGIAAPLSRVPPAPALHHRPSRTAWSLSRFLSEAWEVERVVPGTRLAPGKNASNISLMWWRLARRLQLSPWESSVVNRLLTPTHAFLARSKSAAALSGDAGKTVKVHLPQWGKVLLSKPSLSRPICIWSHLSSSHCVLLLHLVGWRGKYVCWRWFHAPGLVPLRFHLSILSGHQMPGRQKMSLPVIWWLQRFLSVPNCY